MQQHKADSRQGQRHQHADKAEQLPERHQRKNHPKRRQPDFVAHNFRRNQETFQKLPHGKHRPHGNQAVPRAELQQRGERCQQQPGERAQIGHKHQNTRHHADGKARFQAREHQPRAIERAHNQHHHQLPAQKFAQHGVHIAGDAGVGVQITARHQLGRPRFPARPIQQKVIQQKRQQHDVAQTGCQRCTALHQRGQGLLDARLDGLRVAAQPVGGGFVVEREVMPEFLVKPRQRGAVDVIGKLRQLLDDALRLLHQHRYNHQQQRGEQKQREQHHPHGGAPAFDAVRFQLAHQWVEDIRQHGGDDKRREYAAEKVEKGNQKGNQQKAGQPRQPRAFFVGEVHDGVNGG